MGLSSLARIGAFIHPGIHKADAQPTQGPALWVSLEACASALPHSSS